MSNVVPFPTRERAVAYRIPLYGDSEVNFAVAIINMFGRDVVNAHPLWYHPGEATTKNLRAFSPQFVIECLKMALESGIFSASGKKILNKILSSVEAVPLSKEG